MHHCAVIYRVRLTWLIASEWSLLTVRRHRKPRGRAMSERSEDLRAGILKLIGRNIIAFGGLEARLRALVEITNVAGTFDPKNPSNLVRRRELRGSESLGTLTDLLFRNLFGDVERKPLHPTSPAAGTLALRYRIEMSKDERKDWRRSAHKLVRERNQLVHNRLEEIYSCNLERLEAIEAQLDAQHSEVIRHLTEFNGLLKQVKETYRDLAEAVSHAEFPLNK